MFITIEGIDRAGKTTQAQLLTRKLGAETVAVREPGGTRAGERMRDLLKDPAVTLDPLAELILFCAARAQLVAEVIRPALEAGRHVVCDRFVDSSVAYQGVARGLGVERTEQICALATDGLVPDLTFYLRLDPDRAFVRDRPLCDRFEDEGLRLQRAVAEGYEEIARRHPERVVVIDADASVSEVHERVAAKLEARL